MGRPAEVIFGVVGGILGVLAALAVFFSGDVGEAFLQILDPSELYARGALTIAAAAVGITAAAYSERLKKASGVVMIASVALGFIGAGLFYTIPAASLVIAGVIAIMRKVEPTQVRAQCPNCGAPLQPFARFCTECDRPL